MPEISPRLRRGLLVVVGLTVLGVAAAPWIRDALQEAKMAEGRDNLEAIGAGLETLRKAHGGFVSIAPYPDPKGLGPGEQLWKLPPCSPECGQGSLSACASFACIDFRPHGDDAFFSYACSASDDGRAVTCAALGDLDGDGVRSLQVYRKVGPNGSTAPTPRFDGLAPDCPLKEGETTKRCPEEAHLTSSVPLHLSRTKSSKGPRPARAIARRLSATD